MNGSIKGKTQPFSTKENLPAFAIVVCVTCLLCKSK